MRTSAITASLSKPVGKTKIPSSQLSYISTRTKLRMFELVHRELRLSGISQAELACRLGLGTDRVCKLLGAPGNWTLNTSSELLFAISGGVLRFAVDHPMEAAARNSSYPSWLAKRKDDLATSSLIESGTANNVSTSKPLYLPA